MVRSLSALLFLCALAELTPASAQSRGGAYVTIPRGPIVTIPRAPFATPNVIRTPPLQRGRTVAWEDESVGAVWTPPQLDDAQRIISEASILRDLDVTPRRAIGFAPQAVAPRTPAQQQTIFAARATALRLTLATEAARVRVTAARDGLLRNANGQPRDLRRGIAGLNAGAGELDRALHTLQEAERAENEARDALTTLLDPSPGQAPLGFYNPSVRAERRVTAATPSRVSPGQQLVRPAFSAGAVPSRVHEPIGFVRRPHDRAGPHEQAARARALVRAAGGLIAARRALERVEIREVQVTARRDALVRTNPTSGGQLAASTALLRQAQDAVWAVREERQQAQQVLDRATRIWDVRIAESNAPASWSTSTRRIGFGGH